MKNDYEQLILDELYVSTNSRVETKVLNQLVTSKWNLDSPESLSKHGHTSLTELNKYLGLTKRYLREIGCIAYGPAKKSIYLTEQGKKVVLNKKRLDELEECKRQVRKELIRPWNLVKEFQNGILKHETNDLSDQVGWVEDELNEIKEHIIETRKLGRTLAKKVRGEESFLHYAEPAGAIRKLGFIIISIYRRLEYELVLCCDQYGQYQSVKFEDLRGSEFDRIKLYLEKVCFLKEPDGEIRNDITFLRLLRNLYAHNPGGFINAKYVGRKSNKKLLEEANKRKNIVVFQWPGGEDIYIWPKVSYCYEAIFSIQGYYSEFLENADKLNSLAPYYFEDEIMK